MFCAWETVILDALESLVPGDSEVTLLMKWRGKFSCDLQVCETQITGPPCACIITQATSRLLNIEPPSAWVKVHKRKESFHSHVIEQSNDCSGLKKQGTKHKSLSGYHLLQNKAKCLGLVILFLLWLGPDFTFPCILCEFLLWQMAKPTYTHIRLACALPLRRLFHLSTQSFSVSAAPLSSCFSRLTNLLLTWISWLYNLSISYNNFPFLWCRCSWFLYRMML